MSIDISRQVVETRLFPLLEVENGKYHVNYIPKTELPVEPLLKLQGRFSSLFKNGKESDLKEIQDHVDKEWNMLLKKEAITNEQ